MLKGTKKLFVLLMMMVLVCGCLCACGGEVDPETAAAIEAACDLADDEVDKLDENGEFDVSGMYVDSEKSYLVMYQCETEEQMAIINGWDDADIENILGAAQKQVAKCFEGVEVDVFAAVMDKDLDALITYVEEDLIIDERD